MIRSALYEEMPVPVRAAWHREAGRALAEAGAPADRVARQLLLAMGGSDETPELLDEWVLSWLADAAELLVGQAPQVAAELLRQAVASSLTGARHDRLAARLAEALYRIGDVAGADRLADQTLARSVDPDPGANTLDCYQTGRQPPTASSKSKYQPVASAGVGNLCASRPLTRDRTG